MELEVDGTSLRDLRAISSFCLTLTLPQSIPCCSLTSPLVLVLLARLALAHKGENRVRAGEGEEHSPSSSILLVEDNRQR